MGSRFAEGAEEFGEAVEERYGAEPLAVVDGGVAAYSLAGWDIVGNTGLSGGDGSVADSAVAGDAYLTGQDDVLADGGGTGQADLGTEQGIFADRRAVANLDEVVDLRASVDAGLAQGSAVDAGISLDFYVIFEDGVAGLGDFAPSSGGFCEAETVGADDGSVLQRHIVAYGTLFAYHSVGVGKKAIANAGVRIDDDVRVEDGVVTQNHVLSDDNIGRDVGAGSNHGGGGDDRRGVNARRKSHWRMEDFKGASEGEIRVVDAEGGRREGFERWVDQYGGGLGGTGEASVLGVGDEGELTWAGVFDSRQTGDRDFAASMERSAESMGEFGEGHG